MPKNAATGRALFRHQRADPLGRRRQHGFPGQSWLTFRQALGLGGNVRKGERGTTVVYADRFIPDEERARARERATSRTPSRSSNASRSSTPPSATDCPTIWPSPAAGPEG